MRKLIVVGAAVGAAALFGAPSAGAVISGSVVQTPESGIFLDPDLGAPGSLGIAGVASGTGNVDIRCTRNNGLEQTFSPLGAGSTNIPVASGTFSTTISTGSFYYERCRLLAVPTGSSPPYSPAAFGGPVVSNAGHELDTFSAGVNAGKSYNYYQAQSALEGYWSIYAAGDAMLNSSYVIDPDTLDYAGLWSGTTIRQETSDSAPNLQIGGRSAVLTGENDNVDLDVPGFQPIQNLQHSIDSAAGGVMRVSESEAAMFCNPTPATCNSLSDAGVRLDQTAVSGDRGHTFEISQRYVNATNADLPFDITYAFEAYASNPGWRFPGESDYKTHAGDEIVQPPGAGPGSFFIRSSAAAACSTVDTACGSVTWYQAPDAVHWDSNTEVWLTYHRTIPANGSITLPLTYSEGYPQSQVDGFAAAAEQSYQTAIAVGKVKRNKKKGTATIAVDVPAAGSVHAEGKNLKTIDLQAASAGTVSVLVKATGKAKKKLKRKGKAKVQSAITYTRSGLDPTSQTADVTLKRKKKRR